MNGDLDATQGGRSPRKRVGRDLSRNPDFAELLVRTPGWEQRVAARLERHRTTSAEASSIEHTLQVTSYGGSGTTALCRHFVDAGLELPASPDHWPYKHSPVPPSGAEVPEGFRVVYVYTDPRDAVLSLFRRGLQLGAYRIFHLRQPSREIEKRLQTLDEYVRAGVDDFELDQHFEAWLQHPAGYPVLFVDFDSLPGTWPAVRDFVGLSTTYPCLEIRTRRSPLSTIDRATADGLTAMYQGLLERIESLPAVDVVE
ncbi:MAG: hypothetical protein ACRDWD_01175 [Acidimicrobiia bacterium]